MSEREKQPLGPWREAIAAAARRAPGGPGGVQLFLEAREDLRVDVSTRGGPSWTFTRRTGLSATSGTGPGDPGRCVHLAEPAPEDVDRLILAAEDPTIRFPATGGLGAEGLPTSGPPVEAALGWIDRAHREITRLAPTVQAHSRWVQFDQQVIASHPGGEPVSDRRRGCRVQLQAWREGAGAGGSAVAEAVFKPGSRSGVAGPEPETVAGDLIQRLRARAHARPARAGAHPVVLGPGMGGILIHEIVGHALEADTARRGTWLTDPDCRVAAAGLTVVDDPRRGRAPWRFDDEGQAAGACPLVGGGKVRSLLHDRSTARHAGRPPTGHGRRSSYREPVRPRMGCTFIAAGRLKPEEVSAGVDGILVRRMEAASVDLRSGMATFRVTDADALRNGRIEAPLHTHLLRVDAREALLNLDRIADDLAFDVCVGSCQRDGQPLAVSVGAPTIWLGLVMVIE